MSTRRDYDGIAAFRRDLNSLALVAREFEKLDVLARPARTHAIFDDDRLVASGSAVDYDITSGRMIMEGPSGAMRYDRYIAKMLREDEERAEARRRAGR